MKLYLIIVTVFLVSEIVVAQDSTNIKVEVPKIVFKLPIEKSYTLKDVQVKFVDVLSDSRCPKYVTCVWAGQAVVLVEVYKNKVLLEQKEIVFEPGKKADKDLITLYSSEEITILAHDVLPIPNSRDKIKKEAYYLQLEISN